MAGLFAGGASAQGVPTTSGVWGYHKNTDEFTDEVGHYLFLVAEKVSPSDKKITMIIGCVDNKTGFVINTGDHILNKVYDEDDFWEVEYRIDDMGANKFTVFSTHSTFRPHPPNTELPFIKRLFNHDKLRMRFKTYDGSETATFKITGIENEVKPIRTACNW